MVVLWSPTNRRLRMATFNLALARVRENPHDLLSSDRVDQLARESGLEFRDTVLTPGNTLRLFAQQVAHGNVACSAVHHLAGDDFSDSAWCQARKRLPMELIRQVHRLVIDEARRGIDALGEAFRWHGHHVYLIDGTSDSMPDTPELRAHYGVPAGCRDGLGFPTSHLLMMMDHASGLVIDCVDSPLSTSDLSRTPPMHAHLGSGDVLLGDVAFSGWAHLALIVQANLHAVMPIHHKRLVDFTPRRKHAHPRKGKSGSRGGKPRSRIVKTLGKDDQIVEYFKPVGRPA